MKNVIKSTFAVLVLFFLFSCAAGPQEPLKIGVVATLSGVGAFQGQQELRGLELAVDEINAKGGIDGRPVKLVIEDSRTDSAGAVTAINKLIDLDGVKFAIGDSWVTTTAAIVPVSNEKGVLLISPVGSLDSLSNDDLFFRTTPVIKDTMDPLAKYAFENGVRKVAILYQDTPFGVEHARDFSAAFERLGGQIVGQEKVLLTATDVRTELSKLAEKKPDAILNLHATTQVGLVNKQAKELGINVVWLSSYGAETSILLKDYGAVAEGLIYPYPYDANSNLPSVRELNMAYFARYNATPDNTAANSYDAMNVLAYAIGQVGEKPAEVKKVLLAMKDFPGGSGLLSFDVNGDVKKEILIKQVKDGKFVRIQ